jgi:N-sulfoglucosamine sulfohydrolase
MIRIISIFLISLPIVPVVGAERPNILLIVSEDNGPELGCYGNPTVQTPVLDRLAADGVRFQNAYVPQAGCSQSRAALLTGLYPHQNGQIGLATWKFALYQADTPNLVRSLKAAGYRTGIIGKLHINPASAFPFDKAVIPSANFGRKRLGDYARHAGEFFSASDEPFFLSVNYPDAHRPFTAQVADLPEQPLTADQVKPLAYFGLDTPELRAQTADYYNCMSRLDTLVGDLLSTLDHSGKASNTLVVYLGDHGADMLRGKRTSYEGGVRIPLIVRWPGQAKSHQVRQELITTLDLMPTLLVVAGAHPVANLPGRSLLPLLRAKKTSWRRTLFTEYHAHSAHNFYPQRTVRNEQYKLIHNLIPGQNNPGYDFTLKRFFPGLPAVIANAAPPIRSAYQRMKAPPAYELYDLKSDPYEFRNLATDPRHAAVLAELIKALATWRSQTNDPLLNVDTLKRLQAELNACFVNGEPRKDRLTLTYTDYFFE